MTKCLTKILIFPKLGTLQIKKIDDYESIYSVNPLHLHIDHASGYIEEKNGIKYLSFDSVDENKELLEKYANVWNEIKKKIKAINSDERDYGENYMKILMMTCH